MIRILFIFILLSGALFAAEEEKKCPATVECLKEQAVTTKHQVKIGGKLIAYEATAGTMLIKNEKGVAEADIFYVAYTKDGEKNRPITFCFNGGPGSSSVWLHLGILGPRKVVMSIDGTPEKPYRLEDNEFSLLDVTDLVFIDPVSTGYSHIGPDTSPKKFQGVEQDIASVAEFIRLYTTKNGRWNSQKFLAGESYGTTRAAGLANRLFEKNQMELSGIILISAILDFQAYMFGVGNDLPYITFLPTYTATAWYHKKLPKDMLRNYAETMQQVEDFAYGPYASALMKGDKISAEEKEAIAEKLALFTGLDKAYILKSDNRVSMSQFGKKLLEDKNRIVSRMDGRVIGIDMHPTYTYMKYDPSISTLIPAFASTINTYLRDELNWKEDREYEVLNSFDEWDFGRAKNQYLNMNNDLMELMTQTPQIKVFVGSGIYDMATPFSATDYTFSHLPIDPSLRKNITMKYYDAGHMMYVHKPSLVRMKKDLATFIGE